MSCRALGVFVSVWAAQLPAPCLPTYLHWSAGTVWRLLLTACQETMPSAAEVGTLTLHVQVSQSCVSPGQPCYLFACSLDSWCSTVVAYGRDADRIARELQPFRTTCLTAGTLADAVELAIELAQPGGSWQQPVWSAGVYHASAPEGANGNGNNISQP